METQTSSQEILEDKVEVTSKETVKCGQCDKIIDKVTAYQYYKLSPSTPFVGGYFCDYVCFNLYTDS